MSLQFILTSGLVLGVLSLPLFFLFPIIVGTYFVIGSIVGLFLLWFDCRFLVSYYRTPELSQAISRSPIFLLTLIPLAIFINTSTGNMIGRGIIISLLAALTLEVIMAIQSGSFQQTFLPTAQKALTAQEQQWVGIGLLGFTAVMYITVLL